MVSVADDSTARVWGAETGKQLAVLKGHTGSLLHAPALFSPDGRRVVTASNDQTARVWDADTGQELAVLNGHRLAVHSASFSPDGRRVVTASYQDRTVRVWDPETGRLMLTLPGEAGNVVPGAFSADGSRIVAVSHDVAAPRTIRLIVYDARPVNRAFLQPEPVSPRPTP